MSVVLHREVTSQESTEVAQWLVNSLKHGGPTSDSTIDASWREKRQRNLHEGRRLKADHRKHYAEVIAARSADFTVMSARQVLDVIAGRFGLSWVDTSRMLSVSVPALRKWRRDENGASADNHRRLANLAGFLVAFEELCGGEPATWLNVPFDADYTVRPRDIYSDNLAPSLIEFAANGGDYRELLESVEPDWRARWARNFETVKLDEETTALVTRSSSGASHPLR